jgi:serine/threonine protein kinase
MESPTKKRKTGKAKTIEEDKEILSSESSQKSKGDNSSKKYSPSIHKKRASKAEEKKVKNARRRLERLSLKIASNFSHTLSRPKRGEMPPIIACGGGIRNDLVLKKTNALEVKKMLKEIKNTRYTAHIAFTKSIKELGSENVEIYKRYERTLEDEIKGKDGQGIDLPTVAKYLYGMLDGVASFHKAGYIHGDLKPNNIVISNGVVKLIDYNESFKAKRPNTSTANMYYAPINRISPQTSDLFAIGSIFIEMMFGKTMKKDEDEPAADAVSRAKANISKKYKGEEGKLILDLFGLLVDLKQEDKKSEVRAEKLLDNDFFALRFKMRNKNEYENDRKAREVRKAEYAKSKREKRQKLKKVKKKM